MTDAQTEARAMPERIWITMEDHAASWAGSFRRWHASDLDHGEEYPVYIRADVHDTALAARDAELAAAWNEFGNVPRNRTLAEHIKAALAELAGLADEERARAERAKAQLAEAHKALEEAEFWLDGALTCKEWRWDADQHEAATSSLANIHAARRAREAQGGENNG